MLENTEMQPQRDLAIVLRSTPYEERHRIVTALTVENGQISALAKNSIQSRRFGGSLEIFAASDWHFTLKPGAELVHLTEAQIREPFEKLRTDFTLLSIASALNEFMLKLAPHHEPCLDLFRLHSNALSALNDASASTASASPPSPSTAPFGTNSASIGEKNEIAFLNAYIAKLLQWSGSQPRLHECLECKISLSQIDPALELSCVVASAGWICPKCRIHSAQHIMNSSGSDLHQSSLRMKAHALFDLLHSLNIPIRQVFSQTKASKQDHQGLFQFLEALYIYHLPGFDKLPLRSLRFLELKSNLQPQAMN